MKYSLFSKFGVEIEYMIVDKETLQVLPISDLVLRTTDDAVTDEVNRQSGLNWSNELVAHVVEVRPALPVDALDNLATQFAAEVQAINALLEPHHACLLPTGAHPFMNPATETVLWQHQWHEVYAHYHTLFNCYRHGWANLQSTHLNFSFGNDAEFARLHAAIRLVLPLIPALAASTPLLEGAYTGFLDSRLEVYRTNQAKYPLITGSIVPEAAWSETEYTETILKPLYAQIAPVDPDKVLSTPALNSRGARVNFAEGRIEIRLVDAQECPQADIAICQFLTALVQSFVDETGVPLAQQQALSHTQLAAVLRECMRDAEGAVITDQAYLAALGLSGDHYTARETLRHLLELSKTRMPEQAWMHTIATILEHGTLATRITRALPVAPAHADIVQLYKQLAAHLQSNSMFGV